LVGELAGALPLVSVSELCLSVAGSTNVEVAILMMYEYCGSMIDCMFFGVCVCMCVCVVVVVFCKRPCRVRCRVCDSVFVNLSCQQIMGSQGSVGNTQRRGHAN